MNILFCGDFGQLPPVLATALYNCLHHDSEDVLAGRKAYKAFSETVVLSEVMRQQGTSPEAVLFRKTLDELRDGPISFQGWQSLIDRTKERLAPTKWESFREALRLYATNREVDEYNLRHLDSLQRPVMRIQAINTGKGAKEASSDDCGNLDNELLLSVGAKVMLIWNLCIDEGLVNGTMATVYTILWADDTHDAFNSMPAMVLIEVDGYTGRATIEVNGRHVIPILPRRQQWESNGSTCTRTQIPLCLAFAITIHKSQGLTLDKAVVNLANRNIKTTLTYVALSRVRHITSLALDGCSAYDRFPKDISLTVKMRMNDSELRQGRPARFEIKGNTDQPFGINPVVNEEEEADIMDLLTAESLAEDE